MTAPAIEPAADSPPEPTATRQPRTGVLRTAPVVAAVGVVLALIGIGLVLRPLSTPTQDCGTALTFLLDGRPNQWVSVEQPPEGTTPEQARDNNDHPCQERAANQARPAAALVAVGTLSAVTAAVTEVVVRLVGRRRSGRATGDRRPAPS